MRLFLATELRLHRGSNGEIVIIKVTIDQILEFKITHD